jgi:hypothetical protein
MWDVREEGTAPSRSRLSAGTRELGDGKDAVQWVRERLGLAPDRLQAGVLGAGVRRGILNCSRQWGKSTITAAKAVHEAFTNAGSLTVVVCPSARQSGEFLRKASGFVRKLRVRPKGDGDNEMSLALPNGSRIVGLPGTEERAAAPAAKAGLKWSCRRGPPRIKRRISMVSRPGALLVTLVEVRRSSP